MDPSAYLCLSTSDQQFSLPGSYSAEAATVVSKVELSSIDDEQQPIYCNVKNYLRLGKLKDLYDNPGFRAARDHTNPFERIGNSIFINRAGVKLANIDAIYHVTPTIFTFDHKQDDADFTFCDIAAGPGGFTQYLQYRYPNSIGCGMTLKSSNLDWNQRIIDMSRFTPLYGADDTGDLYYNWSDIIAYTESLGGVDLVTADGGFEIENSGNGDYDKSLLNKQEWLSSRLLLVQALVGMNSTKIGGNFVLKCFDTVTAISAQTIYLLSLVFESISIFKPVTSRPANSERYIVCINKQSLDPHVNDIMRQAANSYTSKMYVSNLIDEIPESFAVWLSEQNDISITLQSKTAGDLITYMRGNDVDVVKYNIAKFLLIWNLPDTPPVYNKSKTLKSYPGKTNILI